MKEHNSQNCLAEKDLYLKTILIAGSSLTTYTVARYILPKWRIRITPPCPGSRSIDGFLDEIGSISFNEVGAILLGILAGPVAQRSIPRSAIFVGPTSYNGLVQDTLHRELG